MEVVSVFFFDVDSYDSLLYFLVSHLGTCGDKTSN